MTPLADKRNEKQNLPIGATPRLRLRLHLRFRPRLSINSSKFELKSLIHNISRHRPN
jgi:hypothetical protein